MDLGGRRPRDVTRLDYGAVRDQIKDGDIVLFRGRSAVSRMIRWLTRSPYSHAGVVGWWNGRLMVLEAVGKGVSTSRLSFVVAAYSGHCELWTASEQGLDRARVVEEAQLVLGHHYSKGKILSNLWRMIVGRRAREADPDGTPDGFVCSELVSRVWRKGGVDLKPGVPDRFTRPGDIARSSAVRKLGDLFHAASTGPSAKVAPLGLAEVASISSDGPLAQAPAIVADEVAAVPSSSEPPPSSVA